MWLSLDMTKFIPHIFAKLIGMPMKRCDHLPIYFAIDRNVQFKYKTWIIIEKWYVLIASFHTISIGYKLVQQVPNWHSIRLIFSIYSIFGSLNVWAILVYRASTTSMMRKNQKLKKCIECQERAHAHSTHCSYWVVIEHKTIRLHDFNTITVVETCFSPCMPICDSNNKCHNSKDQQFIFALCVFVTVSVSSSRRFIYIFSKLIVW